MAAGAAIWSLKPESEEARGGAREGGVNPTESDQIALNEGWPRREEIRPNQTRLGNFETGVRRSERSRARIRVRWEGSRQRAQRQSTGNYGAYETDFSGRQGGRVSRRKADRAQGSGRRDFGEHAHV